MNFRKVQDTLLAIRRGPPPPTPDGYEPLPNDPYTFVPILPKCVKREIKEKKTSCCNFNYIWCNRDQKQKLRIECNKCGGINDE